MANAAKSNGASAKGPDTRSRQTSKLSSGILGMKFMKQEAAETEDSDEGSGSAGQAGLDEARPQHGFFAAEDPGRWSAPGFSRHPSAATRQKAAAASPVGYADIFGKSSSLGGRRTYGAKPKRVDPEEMVKHYDDGEKRSKKTEKQKQPSRKRLSSEHAETSRSDSRSKQRRRS